MAQSHIIPVEVDEVRVTTVVDGVIDVLMAGTEVAERYMLGPKWLPVVGASPNPLGSMHLVAEHGFSALIKVNRGGSTSTALFDTGVSQSGLLNNLDALEIKAHDLQAIILSHGHADHSLGLPGLVQRLGARNLPLVLHPDAYLDRRIVLPDGHELQVPAPRKSDFQRDYTGLHRGYRGDRPVHVG